MKRILLVLSVSVVLLLPTITFAQSIGIPCDGPECQACHLVDLGENLMTWFIAIMSSVIAAVFAWGGFKMVVAGGDSGAFSEARGMMTNAVVGFIILLSAWLLIDTLIKVVLPTDSSLGMWNKIECVSQPERTQTPTTPTPTTTPGVPTPNPVTGCTTNCTNVPSGITVKPGACSGGGTCSVSSQIAGDLTTLDGKLDVAGVNWQVTEAYPPTRAHQNACHANGTCIDANCIGGCSASQVKTFIDSASASGLKAVYEVKTQAEKDTLVQAGVNAASVSVLGSWISAAHFSVYNI